MALELHNVDIEWVDWRQLWLDNIDIIEYNRNQLYNRPYHYLEVLKNVNST